MAEDYFTRTRLANKLDRDYLLSVKDIGNIRSQIHAERFHKHADPALSMRMLVEDELGGVGGDNILLYQEQQVQRAPGAKQKNVSMQSVLLDPVSPLDDSAEGSETGVCPPPPLAPLSDAPTGVMGARSPASVVAATATGQHPATKSKGSSEEVQVRSTLELAVYPLPVSVHGALRVCMCARARVCDLGDHRLYTAKHLCIIQQSVPCRCCSRCDAGVEALLARDHDSLAEGDVQEVRKGVLPGPTQLGLMPPAHTSRQFHDGNVRFGPIPYILILTLQPARPIAARLYPCTASIMSRQI